MFQIISSFFQTRSNSTNFNRIINFALFFENKNSFDYIFSIDDVVSMILFWRWIIEHCDFEHNRCCIVNFEFNQFCFFHCQFFFRTSNSGFRIRFFVLQISNEFSCRRIEKKNDWNRWWMIKTIRVSSQIEVSKVLSNEILS